MGEDLAFILQCIRCNAKWSMLEYVGIKYYKTHGSILSRYKPTHAEGLRQTTRMWHEYKAVVPGARETLGSFGETDEKGVWIGEWDNIWRPGSPYSLKGKWNFLKQHSDIVKGRLILFFLRKLIYSFGRKYLYIKPVKRWHIKRMYPDVREV